MSLALAAEIKRLQDVIADLLARVEALEAKRPVLHVANRLESAPQRGSQPVSVA